VCAEKAAPESVKEAPPAKAGLELSAFEKSLIEPALADLRSGVRPWDESSVSICPKGAPRECPEALGLNPGELPPGDYIVHSAFRVPQSGEDWKVKYSQECVTTRTSSNGSSTSTNDYSKEYNVTYIGEEKPSTLSPLMKITSPNSGGSKACTFTITAAHPDGDQVIEGSWSVPADD
jgi:hypothetical protein